MTEIWNNLELPENLWSTLTASWQDASKKQYRSHYKQWKSYAEDNSVPVGSPSLDECLQYFQYLMGEGKSHGTICTARSMLSIFVRVNGLPLSDHPLVTRMVKGIGNLIAKPKAILDTWDPMPVIKQLESWGDIKDLDWGRLTRRTMALFLLSTGQRLQTLVKLRRDDIRWEVNGCTITYSSRLKTNNPAKNPLIIRFGKFMNPNLCVMSHLKTYIDDPRCQDADPYLWVTISQLKKAAPSTISNYVKDTLVEGGVDTSFPARTCRHASNSAAKRAGVSIEKILESAGWASENTFTAFYDRPLRPKENTDFLAEIIDA